MEAMTLILDEYGVRQPPSDTRWCTIKCINPDHEDLHGSARVHVEAGAYICLGCGLKASSPARLIMQLKNINWREANRYVVELGGEDQSLRGGNQEGRGVVGTAWTKHRGRKYVPTRGRVRRLA